MSKRIVLLAVLALCLSMLIASGSFAAIGIYDWKAGTSVPVNISYMLNTDATQVKIEIVPAAGGAAVKTVILTDTAYCSRGSHSWTWDGLNDAGMQAPPTGYKAVITATAAPVAGSNLTPLWELDPATPDLASIGSGWKWATVNTNPASQWYGYVYGAASGPMATHNVYMWKPDGTYHGKFSTTCEFLAWISQYSAPFTVEVGPNDNLYVGSFSRCRVTVIDPSGANRLYEVKIDGNSDWNGGTRALGVTGSGANFKMVVTYFAQAQEPALATNLYTSSGQEYPPSPLNLTVPTTGPLYQPIFDSNGDIIMPAWVDHLASSGGSLTKYSMAGALLAQNTNIHRGTGAAWSPDGQYLWVSRFCQSTDPAAAIYDADGAAIYKIPVGELWTATPDTVEKFGFTTTGTGQRAFNIKADGVGNLVASAGHTGIAGGGSRVGVYAPPDAGSSDTRTTSTFTWGGDPSPSVDSTNGPVAIYACSGGTGNVTANVSDMSGYLDISGCYIDLSQFGGAAETPMNRISGSGNSATYQLTVGVPGTTATGDYTCPIKVKDVHDASGVAPGTGSVIIRVTGGTVSGKVSLATANWGVAGATVTATDGTHNYSTTTDADGNYTLNLAPGIYTINAEKGTGYGNTDAPSSVEVTCGAAATCNRKLYPVTVRTVTQGNWGATIMRTPGEPVCVEAVVLRTSAVTGVQQGFNGFYYLWDRSYASLQQGVRVVDFTGQVTLVEGDKVIVEGIWSQDTGVNQGYVNPVRAPFKVSSENALPEPTTYYTLNIDGAHMWNSAYGTFYKASGPVSWVDPANDYHFRITTWTSATNPTLSTEPLDCWILSPTTTGGVRPAMGSLVEVTGLLSHVVSWATERGLAVGKASDIKVIPIVGSLTEAKALQNGSSVIIDLPVANPALIVTSAGPMGATDNVVPWIYVEEADRTSGIKVTGSMPAGQLIWPGDTVRKLAGLVRRTNDDFELALSETPTITPGVIENVPKPIAFTNLALGGGWFGSVPPVFDRGQGLNNQGLFATIYGRVTDIVYETDPFYGTQMPYIVFIDDGAAVKSGLSGDPVVEKTGVKCIVGKAVIKAPDGSEFPVWAAQPSTLSIGDYVVVNGVVGSEWIAAPVNRMRVLRMRYCYVPNSGPPPTEFYDQFQIIQDVP